MNFCYCYSLLLSLPPSFSLHNSIKQWKKNLCIDKHPYPAESQSIPNFGKTDSVKHGVELLKSCGGCE